MKYYIRLVLMDDSRLVKKVYRSSIEQYRKNRTNNWWATIQKLLTNYNLIELWNNDNDIINPRVENLRNATKTRINNYWNNFIRSRIHEESWRGKVEQKSKLRTYRTFKNSLKMEQLIYQIRIRKGGVY